MKLGAGLRPPVSEAQTGARGHRPVQRRQRGEQPQIGRDRGLQREQVDDALLDVEVELVHQVVASDHLVADRRVAAGKRWQHLLEQALRLGSGQLDGVLECA